MFFDGGTGIVPALTVGDMEKILVAVFSTESQAREAWLALAALVEADTRRDRDLVEPYAFEGWHIALSVGYIAEVHSGS
jgi:hypothetical protein